MPPLVLIIDDDGLVRLSLAQVLGDAGIAAITAADGREGMTLVRTHRPRVIVVDLIMPEQDGIETISAIRREAPETRIIAMSGGGPFEASGLLGMAALLGACTTLDKPFDPTEFVAAVERCLSEDGGPQ